MKFLEIGQEVETQIVAITDDCIFLDLDTKSEGILGKSELTDENGIVKLNGKELKEELPKIDTNNTIIDNEEKDLSQDMKKEVQEIEKYYENVTETLDFFLKI